MNYLTKNLDEKKYIFVVVVFYSGVGGLELVNFLYKESKSKLENCVCKTQVMPPCPQPVLTPCHILTHDPQHIQSILETNI